MSDNNLSSIMEPLQTKAFSFLITLKKSSKLSDVRVAAVLLSHLVMEPAGRRS
jgi:hypothetical protein